MPAPRPTSGSSALQQNGEQGLVARLTESAGHKRAANHQVSLSKYFRSADLLQRQAKMYRAQRNEEQLYVMLLRFVSLVVETIPQHQAHVKEDPTYARLRKDSLAAMSELEGLKMALQLKDSASRALEATPFYAVKAPGTVPLSAGNLPELRWDSLQPPPMEPAGSFPGELDFFGLPLQRSVGGAAAPSAPAAPQLPALPTLSSGVKLRPASQATLSKHAILPSQSFGAAAAAAAAPARQASAPAPPAQRRPLYPEFAPPEPPTSSSSAGLPPEPSSVEAQLASLEVGLPGEQQQQQEWPTPSPYGELQLGPQEVAVQSVPQTTAPPAPGDTCCMPPAAPGSLALSEAAAPPRAGVAEVKRRQSIRDVHISVALMDEFMRYAISNTKRGIETCGILAGVLSANDATFTITTLIVPRQEGTTDTVQALNEEDIFEAQDSRGLYPLGWIHTHPTQTCFLSSVDVHTHCGYQTMLDEAVAIVMAPRDPSRRVGIFRLSTPGGLKLVQRCPQRGFHHHPPTETGQPIYELCNHVYLNPRVSYEVLDLR